MIFEELEESWKKDRVYKKSVPTRSYIGVDQRIPQARRDADGAARRLRKTRAPVPVGGGERRGAARFYVYLNSELERYF